MTKRVLLLCLLACAACSKNAPQTPATPAAPAASATPAAAAPAAAATTAKAAAPAPAAEDRVFGVEELDQMVAPIALYPDPLLAQVLMAATYPGDVADAAKWASANPKATGDAAVRSVADQPWDPSVQSLAAFPQVLATLGQDPAWVQKLGDAFLAQPDDVMDAVQRLRHKAKDAGNLDSNKYQNVTVQPAAAPAAGAEAAPMEAAPAAGGYDTATGAGSTDTIVIQSADPEVVYVPSYNPTTAYGTWAYPSYPPPYYPPPAGYYPGSALVRGLAWGTGVAIAGSLWGDMDWGGNDININTSNYNSFNSNRQINSSRGTWQHNAANRDGVPYRDRNSRENYGNRLADSGSRDRMRGDDPARARSREQARQSMDRRGMEGPARTNREAQQRAQNAGRELGGREPGGREGANRPNAGAGNRDAQRAQAQRAAQNRGAENRGGAAQNRAGGAQNRPGAANAGNRQAGGAERHRQQGANNNASRDAARRQQQQRQAPRNDAFAGARQPQQSRQAAQRGQASQQRARQQGGGGGRQQQSHQVNRQPRGGGGGQQRASGGAQRSGGASRSGGAQRSGGGHRR